MDVKKIIKKGFYKYTGLKRMIKENIPSLKNKTGEMVTIDMKKVVQGTISPPLPAGGLGAPHKCSAQGSQARRVWDFAAPVLPPGQCRGKNTLTVNSNSYSKVFSPSFQW